MAANNYLAAIGSTKGALVQTYLAANTDMHSAEDFRRLVIYQRDDTIVRLEDIADVELGAEDYDTLVRYSGQTAVFAGYFPSPTPTSSTSSVVRVELEKLKQEMPSGLDASIGYDASGVRQ